MKKRVTKAKKEAGGGGCQLSAVSHEFPKKPQTHAPPAHTQDMASMGVVEVYAAGGSASAVQAQPSQVSPTIPPAVFPTIVPTTFPTFSPTRSQIPSRPAKKWCVPIPSRHPNDFPLPTFLSHSHPTVDKRDPFSRAVPREHPKTGTFFPYRPSGTPQRKSNCSGRDGPIPYRAVPSAARVPL